MGEVIAYKPWSVVEYPWGSAVVDRRTGMATNIILSDGQELNVEGSGVILHEKGIEFILEG